MTNNLKQVRKQLEDERNLLSHELAQMEEDAQSPESRREGSPFGKREEEATESSEFEKRLSMEKRLSDSISDIERAIQKLDNGTYGVCDVCGKKISPARLEALPQASQCIECKGKGAKGKVPQA